MSIIQVLILVYKLYPAFLFRLIDFTRAANIAIPCRFSCLTRVFVGLNEWDACHLLRDHWQSLFVELRFYVDHARLVSGLPNFIKFNGSRPHVFLGLTRPLLQDANGIRRSIITLSLWPHHLLEQAIL